MTQTQLIQKERMAGLGRIAAGVAHEINNPLGIVTSNFDFLSEYMTQLSNVVTFIDKESDWTWEDTPFKKSKIGLDY